MLVDCTLPAATSGDKNSVRWLIAALAHVRSASAAITRFVVATHCTASAAVKAAGRSGTGAANENIQRLAGLHVDHCVDTPAVSAVREGR